MLITLYTTQIGNVYQKFDINENDITYGDLIKYINLPKHKLFDELDFSISSQKIFNKVFIKTIINLFSYNKINSKEIKLSDEINGDEFTIVFSYEYYCNNYDDNYKKIKNNIENYNNIYDVIKNDPYQIIFIDSKDENYDEICKLAVQQNSKALQYLPPELMTEKIYKLAVQKDGKTLQYVPPELMTDEICKLAVQQNSFYALQYLKPKLMTDEICKLAVRQNGYALRYVPSELNYVKNKEMKEKI